MRFLADESFPGFAVRALQANGHNTALPAVMRYTYLKNTPLTATLPAIRLYLETGGSAVSRDDGRVRLPTVR
jgi:hypothetical protein